jgi:hypothetical protein
MLINNNPQAQAAATLQHIKRPDMDPANATESALYSGLMQTVQTAANTTTQATLNVGDKKADNIDEAFAKTRVQLQTTPPTEPTASATPTPSDTAKVGDSSSARSEFNEYMKKSPAERIREQLLKEQGLTEADVQAMPVEQQDAIAKEVAQRLKDQQQQQVAAKTADPQAQTVKETLAAI